MPTTAKEAEYSWIPWLFVLGFAVVFVANGGVVYFALHSAPGTVSDRSYDEGLNYNRVLARAAAQDALGWQGQVMFMPTGPEQGHGHPGILAVKLYDHGGMALVGAEVEARILRPVGPDNTIELRLGEQRPGEYVAPMALPQIGQWEVRVVARRAADEFEMAKRIDVK